MNCVHADRRDVTAQPQPAATLLLVRHGSTDAMATRLCGRLPGFHLNARGRDEARAAAERLRDLPIVAVYASPLERAIETARPIAGAHGLPIETVAGLHEVDFGYWTGLDFDALSARGDWRRYNEQRARACVPGGEAPLSTSARIVAALKALARLHRGGLVVAVSHAEPIRYARLFRGGRPLDEWSSVTVEPGSISSLAGSIA
jgi:probable phosphoglycerate mutase